MQDLEDDILYAGSVAINVGMYVAVLVDFYVLYPQKV
jgi:hypothetical protein